MANTTMKNQKHSNSKKLICKRSFKLGLIPMLCSNSDASSPSHSSSSTSSQSRLEELQKVFRHLDRDRDGKISGHELSTFFSAMGDEELRSDEVLTDIFFLQ
jgi:calcium-binding protein CML